MAGERSTPRFPPRPEPPFGGEGRPAITVSELTARIRSCLEGSFRFVRVAGEISNYKLHPSGHRYFSLKDEGAQVRVVLFRGRERQIFGEIRDGQAAIVTGSLGVYERKGEYQVYAQSVEVRGFGTLLVELERRKAALAAEGLFDAARKRPLPRFPARIGIVTSRQGAALRDMVRIARDRWPPVRIVLAPALVQGEGAARDLAEAIALLAARGAVELLIVGRGGGSVEDLWAFHEEAVVRAVAACPVPVISAVGHETDVTLCDLAADLRAPTPSAAVQMALPDRKEWSDRVSVLARRLGRAETGRREALRREWRIARGALPDPRPLLAARRYAASRLAADLEEGIRGSVREGKERLFRLADAVRRNSPAAWAARKRGEAALLSERNRILAQGKTASGRRRLEALHGTLCALDPKGVLARGYAIAVRRDTGAAIRSPAEVLPGDPVDVTVARGSFGAIVEKAEPGKETA